MNKPVSKKIPKKFGGTLPLSFPRGVRAKIVCPIFYLGHWAGSNELLHDDVAPSDTLQILKIKIFQLWSLFTEGVEVKLKQTILALTNHPLSEKNPEKIFFGGHFTPPQFEGVGP